MNDQLIIQKVGNGWVLIWPLDMPAPHYMSPEEQIRWQARVMKEEITGDDEIKKLQAGEDQEGFPFKLKTANHIFVFYTTKKLIEFITEHLK